jgi:hypothetical protein
LEEEKATLEGMKIARETGLESMGEDEEEEQDTNDGEDAAAPPPPTPPVPHLRRAMMKAL